MALAPLNVETDTSTTPKPGGETALICVLLTMVKLAAGVEPNQTAVWPR
ncbi:hypothetical protein LMG18101_01763 [Ralstonia flaminis]|uniref:Uncharacterized protein n=1 Tax=Ralstonia flaminis TaxID=3058597 RepID=A0ABN9JI82_9RALS|nr:hypothetical protein LMG18101_01763 [Ralstonia sp. LMG 18101]